MYFVLIIIELAVATPFLDLFLKSSPRNKKLFLYASFFFGFIVALINVFVPQAVYKENILTKWLIFTGYFYAGTYLADLKLPKKLVKKTLLIFFGSAILNALANYLTTLRNNSGQYFFTPYSPFIIIMTLAVFLSLFDTDVLKLLSRLKERSKKLLIYFSSLIFGIYLIHPMFIEIVDEYTPLRFDRVLSPIWFYMIIKICLVFLTSLISVFFLKKIPLVKKLVE